LKGREVFGQHNYLARQRCIEIRYLKKPEKSGNAQNKKKGPADAGPFYMVFC